MNFPYIILTSSSQNGSYMSNNFFPYKETFQIKRFNIIEEKKHRDHFISFLLPFLFLFFHLCNFRTLLYFTLSQTKHYSSFHKEYHRKDKSMDFMYVSI